jgi:hypothetical protein
MLVEARLERGELSLEKGKLLLLLGYNRQQSHKGMLDKGGRRCPIIDGNAVGWW